MEPFEIRIEKVVFGGEGLGRFEGRVVFVPFSAPGDRLLVRVTEEKKSFLRASILEVREPGPWRVTPQCGHFGRCGGCQWQHLEYARQVEIKRSLLREILHHHFTETRRLEIPMRASPGAYGYRSRARIQLRGAGGESIVGFLRSQSHAVEDVASCPLLRPPLDEALVEVRRERLSGVSDPEITEIDIACSADGGHWAAAAVPPRGRVSAGADRRTEGRNAPELFRPVGPFQYRTAPSVFFQANDFMIEALVETASRMASKARPGRALDLYSGVGLFTLPLSRRFEEVTAVESSPRACALCEENAAEAGAGNVRVVRADVCVWMKAVASAAAPGYDLVLLDPPRAGAGKEVADVLGSWAPGHIVFVSCDIHTLCRDLRSILRSGYQIDEVEGLDLFPQTHHFETVVHLRRSI